MDTTALREALDAHERIADFKPIRKPDQQQCRCGWVGESWADHREHAVSAALRAESERSSTQRVPLHSGADCACMRAVRVLTCGCTSDGNQILKLCTPHAEAAR